MARARKSHDTGEENTNRGLPPAYSPKVDGHKYVIYASLKKEGDPYPRQIALKFLATYAARYMVDKLIGKDDHSFEPEGWMERDGIIKTSTGITIRASGSQLKEIIDYDLNEQEAEWQDPLVLSSINRFKYGKHEEAANDDHRAIEEDESDDAEHQSTKPRREKKIREPKARVDTAGYISANDIAKELKVEGREVRGVLRSLKLEKPPQGWSWPKDEANKIREKIIAGLKEAKKPKGKGK